MRRGSGLAVVALAALLASCSEPAPEPVRPRTQPLAQLNTPEARRYIEQTAMTLPDTQGQQMESMCAEVLRVSEQGRLILDRSDPARLVVNRTLWSRIPVEGRQAIRVCAESDRVDGASGTMAVVESDPSAFPAP